MDLGDCSPKRETVREVGIKDSETQSPKWKVGGLYKTSKNVPYKRVRDIMRNTTK